jgi:NADH-quinone oxidoreductase subunit N
MLLAVLSNHSESLESLLYYAVTYGATTIGAFGVVAAVERSTGGDQMSNFSGLSRQSPLLSLCMLVFLLSLAGIPPLAGFFGKFYVFTAALNGGPGFASLGLVILAIATSAVSLYYYLQVLKRIYVADPSPDLVMQPVPAATQIALVIIAGGVILLGCAPNLLLSALSKAVELAEFLH